MSVNTDPTPRITVIRGHALLPAPWKNGGGVTREIAVYPDGAGLDDFLWRVSLADVARAGPFSRFPGIDRTLVLLGGTGMVLTEADGPAHPLDHPYALLAFAGETPISATLIDGPTRDFNLMVRRGAVDGQLDTWHGAGTHRLDADTTLLYCAHGPVTLQLADGTDYALDTGDTLRIDAAASLACRLDAAPDAALLAVQLRMPASPTTPDPTERRA